MVSKTVNTNQHKCKTATERGRTSVNVHILLYFQLRRKLHLSPPDLEY